MGPENILTARPLIAIRISVLQYASREFLLERYSAHAVPAEYLRAGPLLNLVSTGSGKLPEALNTSTPVLYLLIHICIGSAYCHAVAAANLRASVLLNFVRNTLKGLLVGLPEWPSCPRAQLSTSVYMNFRSTRRAKQATRGHVRIRSLARSPCPC